MSSCPAIVFPCFIVSTWVSPNENMSSQMDVNCFQAEIICLLYYLMVIFSSLFFSAFNNSGSNSIELKKAFKAASYNLSCCERNGTFNIFWYLQKSKKPCQRWNWSRKSLPKKGENPPLEKIAFQPSDLHTLRGVTMRENNLTSNIGLWSDNMTVHFFLWK